MTDATQPSASAPPSGIPSAVDVIVTELRAQISELKGLRGDFHLFAARLEAAELATSKASGEAKAAAATAAQAYDQATAAMRATSEVRLDVADAKAAMVRHAETVSRASQAMVDANAAQTPIIEQTLAIVTVIKKNWPAVAATIAAAVIAIATIVGQAVSAYQNARSGGHTTIISAPTASAPSSAP